MISSSPHLHAQQCLYPSRWSGALCSRRDAPFSAQVLGACVVPSSEGKRLAVHTDASTLRPP